MTNQKPVNIFELGDLSTPWCLRVVVTLKIAELISEGTTSIVDLATKTYTNPRMLVLVLRTLVAKGVFEELELNQFTMNKGAEDLKSQQARFEYDLQGLGGKMTNVWSTLLKFVQTGESYYPALFGKTFWEDLDTNPDLSKEFNELMGPAGHGQPDVNFEITDGWKDLKTIADVGGGTGSMLLEILRLHPTMHGILIDLPKTIDQAKLLVQESGLQDRMTFLSQSFFDPLPQGYDIYMLRKVIGDWSDSEAKKILQNCKQALPKKGKILIAGGIIAEREAKYIPIQALLCGGIDRTIEEYEKLLYEVGLTITKVLKTKTGQRIIECAVS